MGENIRKSVLAGLMISIGGFVNLACGLKGLPWAGALLFAVGLFTICEYGFNLYTGKAGYIAEDFSNVRYIGFVVGVLAVNLATTFAVGAGLSFLYADIAESARALYSAKLSAPLAKSFVSAVLCGVLMFAAVDAQKRGTRLGIFLAVPAFILAGFDHSIANSFYGGLAVGADTLSLRNLAFTLTVVLGNAAGCMLIPLLMKTREKTASR